MVKLAREQVEQLKDWFHEEAPGYLVGQHILSTGHGTVWTDHWPAPRALFLQTSDNFVLFGQPEALSADLLRTQIQGFVEAPDVFMPLLKTAFPDLKTWPRVVYALEGAPHLLDASGSLIRPLSAIDTEQVKAWAREVPWICETWGGPAGLATSSYAWGAFVTDQLISIACSFFIGTRHEEIGVATHPEFRGRGISPACAGRLCEDIRQRGRQAIWSTGVDWTASIRVAEKLGFQFLRNETLYVAGMDISSPS